MANQTENGKAFEYACMIALYERLKDNGEIVLEDSSQMQTAKKFFDEMDLTIQNKLVDAANAAARVVIQLEPQLFNPQDNVPLYIAIQTDAQGIAGDVRDVVCIRKQNKWQIGLSCKHNHHAVKHSRLSDTIDFGKEWFNIPCSKQYFSEVTPIFSELRTIRDKSKDNGNPALWADVEDKAKRYYVPILQSFLDELNRLASANPEVPGRLINYLLGRYDFYKIITDDKHKTTRVEAINICGSLGRNSGNAKPLVNIEKLKLPTRFYHAGFKRDSNNTVEVVCDEGWTISMRIHNASSRIEPSLKFDVQLVSLPSSIYAQMEPWDNVNEGLVHRIQAYASRIIKQ